MSNRQSEHGSRSENFGVAPAFAQASSVDLPSTFEQAISEVPSGIKSSVIPPAVKLTSSSVTKLIKRNAIIATHWYNTPLVDGLKSVATIYKVVEAAAFNYQRTHQDAFFEAYPELVIAKQSEGMTTADLRRNYRTYCKRIAHYWYEYGEAKKMQLASLINLMTMTRLNGNETMKHFASDMRWSRINTACVLAERFPAPMGLESYMTGHSRFATGKTTFGADIISIGLWKADVLGTVGQKTLPLDNFIRSTRDGSIGIIRTDDEMSEYPGASQLINTVTLVLSQYANELNHEAPYGQIATSPDIENGPTRAIQYGTHGLSTPLNRAGSTEFTGKFNVTSALSKKLWASYDMWTNHLTWAFPEMLDPNNDRYTFATEQLKLFEKSSKLEDLIKVLRSNENYDITSLANLMIYKSKNSANSATIVKWAPALYDPEDAETGAFGSDTLIALNAERYDVTNPNTVEIIKSAKGWPHLNPTMFVADSDTDEEPLILNSSITVGQLGVPDGMRSEMKRVITPTGKYATMLDYAVSASVAPDVSKVAGFGVSESTFTQYVADGNSVVYEELPDSPWLMRQPLIDPSDLAQCGFNILISDDDPNPNEWVKYFTEKRNYVDSTVGNFVGVLGDDPYVPASHAYGTLQTVGSLLCFNKAHVTNPAYRELKEHMLVFVGTGIFSHPWFCGGRKTSGYFVQHHYYSSTGTTVPSDVARLLSPQDSDPTWAKSFAITNTMASEYTEEDDSVNPASYIIQLLSEQSSGNTLDMYDFVFSPDYGPIDIGAIIPDDADDNMVPPFLSNNFPAVGQDGSVVPEIGFTDMSVGSTLTGVNVGPVAATLKQPLYDPLLSPGMWLLYFLDYIQFPKVKVDAYGGYTVSSPETAVVLHFGDVTKWKYSLKSRVVSQFVGIHDTKPFWDNTDMSVAAVSIEASSRFPENNILAEPRRVQAEKRNHNKHQSGGKINGRSETQLAASNFSNGGGTGKSANSWKREGGRRNKYGKSGHKSEEELTNVNSDATGANKSEMNGFGAQNSNADYSTTPEDKSFDEKKKGKLSDSNLLGTV